MLKRQIEQHGNIFVEQDALDQTDAATIIDDVAKEKSRRDDKPSHLPRKMKELFGGQLQDEFLKNLWLQRLPSQIQALLSFSMETFDKLAEIADVALLTAVYSATSAPEPNTSAEIQELAK
ncbi:hypothetical protein TNCV_3422641 [Trichonephila clavipes]|nr:hypothetical protein TNCV_3422641 [Trichonephila clavipes]